MIALVLGVASLLVGGYAVLSVTELDDQIAAAEADSQRIGALTVVAKRKEAVFFEAVKGVSIHYCVTYRAFGQSETTCLYEIVTTSGSVNDSAGECFRKTRIGAALPNCWSVS